MVCFIELFRGVFRKNAYSILYICVPIRYFMFMSHGRRFFFIYIHTDSHLSRKSFFRYNGVSSCRPSVFFFLSLYVTKVYAVVFVLCPAVNKITSETPETSVYSGFTLENITLCLLLYAMIHTVGLYTEDATSRVGDAWKRYHRRTGLDLYTYIYII